MRRRREANGKQVELLNIPLYSQGTFDSLCAYYTGAMMLASLFPEYGVEFGTAKQKTTKKMSLDPFFRAYGDEDHRHVTARLFHHGETVERVVKILNTNMAEHDSVHTEFKCEDMTRHEKTFNTFVSSIDLGLPVMLGWNTEDYGCHAVLVTGYWIGEEKWLTINDPGGGTEISWNSLKAQQKGNGRFEVGLCTTHTGPRPMKAETIGKTAPEVFQWTPDQEYERVKDLFQ